MVYNKLILIVALLLLPSICNASVIFSDTFDGCTTGCAAGTTAPNSAGWDQWNMDNLSATYNSVTKPSGEITTPGRGDTGKSLKVWKAATNWVGSSSYAGALYMTSGGAYTDFWIRYYVKMPTDFNFWGDVGIKLFRLNTTGGEIYIELMPGGGWYRGNSTLEVLASGRGVLATSSQLLSLWDGNWHCWQFHFDLINHQVSYYADGDLLATVTNANLTGNWNNYMQHWPMGNAQGEDTPTWQTSGWQAMELDDLIIATTKAETDPDGEGGTSAGSLRHGVSASGVTFR